MRHGFIYLAIRTPRICEHGQLKIPMKHLRSCFMTKRSVFGVQYPGVVSLGRFSLTAALTLIVILKTFFVPFSEQVTVLENQKTWFQQDGATAHTARAMMTAVGKVFRKRVISRDLWPPRSPNLTPPDFYLWKKLKGLVYADNPRSINDSKHNVRQVIAGIRCEELHQIFCSVHRRVELCPRRWLIFPATLMIS